MNLFRLHKIFIISLSCLILGIGIGYFIHSSSGVNPTPALRENSDRYKFINPLLLGSTEGPDDPQYRSLKNAIDSYVTQNDNIKNLDGFSVYFRDLNSGKSMGINEGDEYFPGSMLKVVVMLSYLRLAEDDPDILDKNISYQSTHDEWQFFKPTTVLKTGSYPARTLISQMIVDSDNDAVVSLTTGHDADFQVTMKELNLPIPKTKGEDYMSARSYSTVFRILYNGTYISRNLSEQALALLSKTTFTQGLVAGVPKGVVVSHKFGEYTSVVGGNVTKRELHDCGIVYKKGAPYFLCIMTKGSDFTELARVIAGISKIVYENK